MSNTGAKELSCLVACALALLLPASASAGNLSREVSGWYNDGWNAESHAAYMANDHVFSEVNPYWYDLSGTDGSISERTYAYTRSNVEEAHANGDLVVPSIADRSAGQIDTVLAKPASKKKLIDSIVARVLSRGYDGFDLNFESGTPNAKAAFSAFVGELAAALHANGKRLEVTVQPATSANEEAAYLFDYGALAASGVDRIKVMAYDHNFDAGANVPGPIAPVAWMRDVLRYLTVTRGVPSTKIQLGLHEYGWTWKKAGAGWKLIMPHDSALNVEQVSRGSAWQWDPTALESWKQYAAAGQTYRTYLGTADTVDARLGLVDEFNLAGVAFWVLGREDANVYRRFCAHYATTCGAPSVHPVVLSRGRPVEASSSFDAYYTAAKAVDGSTVEGWIADPADATPWLSVDLGGSHSLTEVKLYWGGYDWSVAYDIETSTDGASWTTAYHTTNNADGGLDAVALGGVDARYVRVRLLGPKSDGWSYEIYELAVSGMP